MWKRLPLRFRLFLPTIGLIAASLLFGIFALEIFSPDQFENESEDAAALVQTVTKGLNAALAVSQNPEPTLNGLPKALEPETPSGTARPMFPRKSPEYG